MLGAMPAEMKQLLDTLLQQNNLTREEACAGVEAIIEGADPCQAAAFLVLLKAKGETGQEVAGMVSAMRNHMIPVSPGVPCVDIVGTGGDGHHTVNFSTAASVVAAACGASVAKHGNRSVSSMCAACTLSHPPYSLRPARHWTSSAHIRFECTAASVAPSATPTHPPHPPHPLNVCRCGSADVLETLGVDLALPAAGIERCIKEAGIAFMFAPNFHPAMKHIVPVRKAPAARRQRHRGGATARCPGLLGRTRLAFDCALRTREEPPSRAPPQGRAGERP